ncbi:hypothetical protein QEN19_003309 [Hanseniaspora menglaensis]
MRQGIVDFCKKNEIALEAYSPLTHAKKLADPELVDIAKKNGISPTEVLLKWSVQKGFIPLPKSTSTEHMASNFNIFNHKLSEEDILKLSHPEAHQPTGWECTECD